MAKHHPGAGAAAAGCLPAAAGCLPAAGTRGQLSPPVLLRRGAAAWATASRGLVVGVWRDQRGQFTQGKSLGRKGPRSCGRARRKASNRKVPPLSGVAGAGQARRRLPAGACWQPHGEARLGLSSGGPRPTPSTELLVCPASGTAGAGFPLQGLNNAARVLREGGYAPQNLKRHSR